MARCLDPVVHFSFMHLAINAVLLFVWFFLKIWISAHWITDSLKLQHKIQTVIANISVSISCFLYPSRPNGLSFVLA